MLLTSPNQNVIDLLPPVADGAVGLPRATWELTVKSASDVILASVLAVVTLPVMLLAMALVKLTSRGPAIYSQTRVGLGGKPFTIYKVRTMHVDCERLSGPVWSSGRDPRVFPVGRVLRVTHLDELPQLWNVLRGEMSLVGPRPERPEFVAELEKAVPGYRRRVFVRPGVTGLAQIHLGPDTDHTSVRRKLMYDLYYMESLGGWLDLRIILCTGFSVVGIPFEWARVVLRIPSKSLIASSFKCESGAGGSASLPSPS